MAQTHDGSDFTFPAPEGWSERSMVGFAAPTSPAHPVAANILVLNGELPEGETLDAFVTRQVDDLAARAEAWALKLRREARLDGAPAIEIVFSWRAGAEGRLQQRQVYAERPGRRVVTITHTAAEAEFSAWDPAFVTMLSRFLWKT